MEKVLISDKACLRAIEPADVDNIYRWENDTTYWDLGCSTAPYSKRQILNYIVKNLSFRVWSSRASQVPVSSVVFPPVDIVNISRLDSTQARLVRD